MRFTQVTLSVVHSTRISPDSCKYSKRAYAQPQLLTQVIFREFRNQHYREFINNIREKEYIQEIFGLSDVPPFTTLQRFLRRIKLLYFRITFWKTVNQFYSNEEVIPITATNSSGFTSGYCSHYFSERTGKLQIQFLKTAISLDTAQ